MNGERCQEWRKYNWEQAEKISIRHGLWHGIWAMWIGEMLWFIGAKTKTRKKRNDRLHRLCCCMCRACWLGPKATFFCCWCKSVDFFTLRTLLFLFLFCYSPLCTNHVHTSFVLYYYLWLGSLYSSMSTSLSYYYCYSSPWLLHCIIQFLFCASVKEKERERNMCQLAT